MKLAFNRRHRVGGADSFYSKKLKATALTENSENKRSDENNTKWLNRNVLGISFTSLFSDMSHEMATTVLPFFVIFIGGSPAIVGLIQGLSDGLASFVKTFSGHYSDKSGSRTPIMYLGYAATGIVIPVIGFATNWVQVLILRVAAWMGRGARGPPRDALLTESVPERYRGRAFGFNRTLDTMGAVIGPSIATVLLFWKTPYPEIFYISFIPGVVSVLCVVFLVKEVKRNRVSSEMGFRESVTKMPKNFIRFLQVSSIFHLSSFSYLLFSLWAEQLLQPTLGVAEASAFAALFYAALNLFYALVSYPAGYVADHYSKRGLLALGYILFAVACLAATFANASPITLIAILVPAGLYIGIVDTVESAFASDLIPPAQRGVGFGLLQTVNGVGDLVSSTAMGVLWTIVSPFIAFSLFGGVAIFASLLMLAFVRTSSALGGVEQDQIK